MTAYPASSLAQNIEPNIAMLSAHDPTGLNCMKSLILRRYPQSVMLIVCSQTISFSSTKKR